MVLCFILLICQATISDQTEAFQAKDMKEAVFNFQGNFRHCRFGSFLHSRNISRGFLCYKITCIYVLTG